MSNPSNENVTPPPPEKSAAQSSINGSSTAKAAEATPKQNPALRMLGLPNWKLKVPSRNWLIFLTVTTSFTCAILYDRHYKKKNQEKWAQLVSRLQNDPLSTKQMPRRLTVYLAAPPGDGLRVAREHFHEYVRPVLEKGGVDWDVVEGRREGDVRAGTAERIRRKRRKLEGVVINEPDQEAWGNEEAKKEEAIQDVRELNGVAEYEGIAGDIVIGRNVWKEYVRGIHEGWLGPLQRPGEEKDESQLSPTDPSTDGNVSWQTASPLEPAPTSSNPLETLSDPPSNPSSDDASPTAQPPPPSQPGPEENKPADTESEPKPKKPTPPEPYLHPTAYTSASLPPSIPDSLGPAAIIPYPHILGIMNTRIRLWRFLNQRKLADQIGREVAAAMFASSRPLHSSFPSFSSSSVASSEPWNSPPPPSHTDEGEENKDGEELEGALAWEEHDWPKSVRKEWGKRWEEDEEKGVRRGESVWLDRMVLDERIASRMRRFVLGREEETHAERIARGEEQVRNKGEDV